MNKKIKQSFLSWLIFSWTVVISFVWFATYTNIATQNDWDQLSATIWNNAINKINSIWTQVDSLSWSQLWVWQTWQDVSSQRILWTTYTNNTWKPIQISIFSNSAALNAWVWVWINWIQVAMSSQAYQANTSIWINWIIIPNWASYYVNKWTASVWTLFIYELK